tara:strand:+ start:55 stop:750 length:696 start_codon:yes stop_codon:yes gene_type:complete
MIKSLKFKFVLIFLIVFIPNNLIAHTQHYNNLKSIEFDIFRNNKHIGKHVFYFNFKKDINELTVKSKLNFEIRKIGIVLYKYLTEGTEIYKDGNLIKFNSTTVQNNKNKYVNLINNNNEFTIDGSSYKGKAPLEYVIGTWWNHNIVKAKAQISAVSGRIIKQNVTFLGNETISIDGKNYETLHFNFSSDDNKLSKDKKLNTDIWYDKETLYWLKASFDKKGKWEYRLINIK